MLRLFVGGPALACLVVLVLPMILVRPAQAYVDPGTGSFIVQALIAVVLGGLVTLKHYWGRVRNLFGRSAKAEDEVDFPD